jgi:hypothetical protein
MHQVPPGKFAGRRAAARAPRGPRQGRIASPGSLALQPLARRARRALRGRVYPEVESTFRPFATARKKSQNARTGSCVIAPCIGGRTGRGRDGPGHTVRTQHQVTASAGHRRGDVEIREYLRDAAGSRSFFLLFLLLLLLLLLQAHVECRVFEPERKRFFSVC